MSAMIGIVKNILLGNLLAASTPLIPGTPAVTVADTDFWDVFLIILVVILAVGVIGYVLSRNKKRR